MARANLTSTEARTRIKDHVNEAYRALQTSIGLGRVRRSVQSFATTNGNDTYNLSNPTVTNNVIKTVAIYYEAGNRILTEVTDVDLRTSDPDLSRTGAPETFVVLKYQPTYVTIRIHPVPDAAYTLKVDGLVQGTDMSADADVPAFPEDYHDILVHDGLEEEFGKMEKPDLAREQERKSETRKRDLRYFLAKSAFLHTQQAFVPWWWGPYISKRWGWW